VQAAHSHVSGEVGINLNKPQKEFNSARPSNVGAINSPSTFGLLPKIALNMLYKL